MDKKIKAPVYRSFRMVVNTRVRSKNTRVPIITHKLITVLVFEIAFVTCDLVYQTFPAFQSVK